MFAPQQIFICSKSAKKKNTIKNVWNLFKVNNKDDVVLVSVLLTLNRFHTFFNGVFFFGWLWTDKCLLGRLHHKCFPVNIAKYFKTPILKRTFANSDFFINIEAATRGVLCKMVFWEISKIHRKTSVTESLF